VRRRQWALEEQLLGPDVARQRATLREKLTEAVAAVTQLETDLRQQRVIAAALKQELDALQTSDAADHGRRAGDGSRLPVVTVAPANWSANAHLLSRCDGFAVETSAGRSVGVVDGVRFGRSIDRPDVLEVDTGRFREHILLVPVEDIERISAQEERVILTHDPIRRRDLAHELSRRIRSRFHTSASAH
jgi:hypothetical protein